jgi:RimJ/RimL family protein N-acetyltransferase
MDAIPLPEPPLADEQLVLGPFSAADVGALVEACNDSAVARFTFIPAPYGRADAELFVGGQTERRLAGEAIDLAIRAREGGALLGATGLRVFRPERASCEIGYWVTPHARGHGVAPRAVGMLARWALRALPLDRIELTPDVENRASQRVAEKAGFTLTAERRETFAKGRRWEFLVYALNGAPGRGADRH